jgi:hypothetical protein
VAVNDLSGSILIIVEEEKALLSLVDNDFVGGHYFLK